MIYRERAIAKISQLSLRMWLDPEQSERSARFECETNKRYDHANCESINILCRTIYYIFCPLDRNCSRLRIAATDVVVLIHLASFYYFFYNRPSFGNNDIFYAYPE